MRSRATMPSDQALFVLFVLKFPMSPEHSEGQLRDKQRLLGPNISQRTVRAMGFGAGPKARSSTSRSIAHLAILRIVLRGRYQARVSEPLLHLSRCVVGVHQLIGRKGVAEVVQF
jgi:hypothetical protein